MQLDPNDVGQPGYWQFNVGEHSVLVIADENSDRMPIMSPEQLLRMMQASFDSTVDVRYSIAKGSVSSAFIHPLSSPTNRDFVSGVGQIVNAVKTYGTSYASGF